MILFDADSHRYWREGREFPSVTRLLAHFGILEVPDVPESILERARQRGTAAHLAVRLRNEGTLDPASVAPELEGYLYGYDACCVAHEIVPHPDYIERPLVCPVLGLAGTPDLGATVRGDVAVVDVKCTASLPPAVGVQLAAYQLLLRAAGLPVTRRFALQLRPDGTYTLQEYRDPLDAQEVRAALLLYHRRAAREGGRA